MKKFLTIVLASTLQLGLFAGSGWQVRCFKNENSPYTQCKAVKKGTAEKVPDVRGVGASNAQDSGGRQNAKNPFETKSNQTMVNSELPRSENTKCEVSTDVNGFARSCSDDRKFGPYASLAEAEFMASRSMDGRLSENNVTRIVNTGECTADLLTEANILIAKDANGGYYWTDRKWYENQKEGGGFTRGEISAAPGVTQTDVDALKRDGLEFVESIHNHYNGLFKWPTNGDAMSSIGSGKPVVVYGCNDSYYKIDPINGNVYPGKINGTTVMWSNKPITLDETSEWDDVGKSSVFKGSFSNQIRRSDFGKDLYDGKNPTFKQLRDWVDVNLKGKRPEMSGASKMPDLTKLINLFKQAVEYLRRMNAMSNKPGEEYYVGYNKLGAKARAEMKVIEDEIAQMNLTEAEKVELGNELGKQVREKVMPYCDTLESLKRQLEAKGYGRFEDSNFNFNPKYFK